MNFIKKFLQWIVDRQLVIAVGGGLYFLTGYTLLLGDFQFCLARFLLISGGTWITYGTYRGIFNLTFKPVLTSIVYASYLIPLLVFVPWFEVLFLLHLALLSFFYKPASFVKTKLFSLRRVPLFKLIILSYIWASLSSFYPALVLDISVFSRKVSNLFWIQFSFILAITIPFDIRDFYLDIKDKLITMPRIFGFKNSKMIASFFLLIFTILIVSWDENFFIIFIVSAISFLLIWRSDRNRSLFYYSLWLDGLLILYFAIVFFHYS